MFHMCIVLIYGAGVSIAISGASTIPSRPTEATDESYRDLVLGSVSFKLCVIGLGILVCTALVHVLSMRIRKTNDRVRPLDVSPTAIWAVRTALKN